MELFHTGKFKYNIMQCTKQTVLLKNIDLKDETYRITTKETTKELARSISMAGLINLPVLVEKKSNYIIVCGFCRIKACMSLGWAKIEARILSCNDNCAKNCVNYAITDNSFQRQLNLVEQSKALTMLSKIYKDINMVAKQAAILALPSNAAVIKKILKISHLPLQIRKCILSNSISLGIATKLQELDNDTAILFTILFSDLKLSLSKQREIIELSEEIALREDISITEIFTDPCLNEISANDNLDRNQKSHMIRQYLKKRRFPAITKAEQDFKNNVKNLALGSNISLIPPKNFEGSTYLFKISFTSFKELKDCFKILDNIIINPVFKKILE